MSVILFIHVDFIPFNPSTASYPLLLQLTSPLSPILSCHRHVP